MNLPAIPSSTEVQLAEIQAKLRPAEDHVIARIITGLLDFGFVVPSSIKAEKFNDKYRFALQGISETALRETAAKLARGEYAEQTSNFLPIPAEFAKLARREERPLREDRVRLRDRIDGIAAATAGRQERQERDPAMVERVRAMAASAVQDLRSTRPAQEMPIDEERADELRRIMAMNDAPGLTAEQKARQRKAAADLKVFDESAPPPKKHGVECAMLCEEPTFKVFMQECHGAEEPLDKDTVAEAVRQTIGIESRSELNKAGPAVARWLDLRAEYQAWMQV